MTRNPGTPPAWSWLSNSTILKFCHLSYMVIISHNFKALPSLLWLSRLAISKFCQPSIMEFFQIDDPSFYFFLLFFLEIGRNYIMSIMSVIITIVSNITVLVSQNIVFFGFLCLWAMVSIRRLLQVPPPNSLSPTRFSPGWFVVLQNAWSTFCCCDQVTCER